MANPLHDRIFDFFEGYRAIHPDFVYWLRERNTKDRLQNGSWFQGTEKYAFVGLYDRAGGSNMTRSIGLTFVETPKGMFCQLEIVFNEEKDKDIITFYKELIKMLGGFEKSNETKYQKILTTTDGYKEAENFLNNIKPTVDALINKMGLQRLFINKDKFKIKLENILRIRGQQNVGLFPPRKINELKARFAAFKSHPFYIERIPQLQFVPFAKEVIELSMLNPNLNNNTFKNLIQSLKNGALTKTVELCLTENIADVAKRNVLIKQYNELGFTGYTGAGKASIYGLSAEQLNTVKEFLLTCSRINNINDAVSEVVNYDAKKIPLITKGIYSPWLYYLNAAIFPIQNNSHNDFIKWCEQPADSYPLAIQLFHEVATILGEKDLGIIDAFTHMFISGDVPPPIVKNEITTMSLNTILYGPPGTGKTYNTINKAVAIANPEFDVASATREQLRTEYERLVKDGQIEFVTFHQSLSYEDFIEGIKPMEPKEGDPFLKYQVMDGIFKRLAERASKVPDSKPAGFSIDDEDFQKAGFYKISLGDTSNPDDDNIYEWCIKNGYIALGWGDAINFTGLKENDIQQMVPAQLERFAAQAVNYFIHYIKPGDYVVVTYGNLQFRAIGKVTGTYEFINVDGLNVHQFRKVEWLLTGAELPYEEVYNKQFSQQSIYRLDKREIKKDFFVKAGKALPVNNKPKNYVLIIDEINRGNVSQIFGELITLIEEDKRAGKNEALTVVLPYSKKPFSVPSNLYIVGTMNTADRSVEALDTALRRRFVFEEMMPKPELLSPQAMIWKLWWDYEKVGWPDKDYVPIEQSLYNLLGVPEDFNDDDDKEVIWNKMKAEGPKESQTHLFDDVEFDGLNFQLLLEKINQRIEKILGKDQQIGHSFFINVISIEDLYSAIYQKLIPQLQEYFYGDFGKIGLILGRDFISYKSIPVQFADFKYEDADLLLERKIYQINTFKIERGIDLDAFAEAVLKIYTPNNI